MPAQSGGSGQTDNSLAPLWIAGLVILAGVIFWYKAHGYIVAVIFKINILQGLLINFFMHDAKLANNIYIMQTIDPNTVSWSEMITFCESVGDFFRYPAIVVTCLLAIYLYRSNITLRFRRMHNMKTLRSQEQHNWPAIMPITKHDINEEDVNKGPWAMALSPLEFALKYNLLRKDDAILDNPLPGEEMTAGIRKSDAKRVFTLQLGPYWESLDHCPPHTYALIAVFLSRINRDKDSASLILETIDKTYATGKPDFSVAKPILKKYRDCQEIKTIVNKHAYLLTVVASLIEEARLDGVVPSSEFLWLKTVDRRLWYMLNSIGRQTPFTEVAGPFAHWKAEKAMGRRSLVPMIDEATKALEAAIKEVKLSPQIFQELKT